MDTFSKENGVWVHTYDDKFGFEIEVMSVDGATWYEPNGTTCPPAANDVYAEKLSGYKVRCKRAGFSLDGENVCYHPHEYEE